jgi:hypothetical protein
MQLLSTQTKLEAECTSLNAKIAELEKAHRLQIVELQSATIIIYLLYLVIIL